MKNGIFYGRLMLGLLLAICGIAGCSSKEPGEGSGNPTVNAGSEKESGEYDFASGSWTMGDEVTESEEPWGIAGYWGDYMLEIPATGMMISKRCTAVDESCYYILERYTDWGKTGAGCQKYYLTCLDMGTMEAERKELKLQEPTEGSGEELTALVAELAVDMDENWTVVTGMSAADGRLCLLALQMGRESKAPSHYYIVWLDAQGRIESAVDLLPEIQRAGLVQDNMVPEGIIYDGKGYYYVGTESIMSGIGIFDGEGRYLKQLEAPGGAGGTISFTGRLPDGRPIFECMDSDRENTIIFCMEDLEQKIFYHGKGDSANIRYPDAGGEVFYPGSRGIVCWDVETGERKRLYQDTSLNPWSYEAIFKTEDGGIVTAFFDGEYTYVHKLQPGAETGEKKIVLFQLYEDQSMQRYADEYSRQHPGVKIELQKLDVGNDYDTDFHRFAAQLVTGEGPDVFVMRREQMEILQRQGVLADLSRYLTDETVEQIFPGVLEGGKVDGKNYGIALGCVANTLAVSESLWQKETWDYPDIIALMEGREAQGRKLQSIMGEGGSSGKLLEKLAIMSINAGMSSLIDEESGKCYFDTVEFVNLLELCKAYGTEPGRDSEGESLAYHTYGDFIGFSQKMAKLGEGYRCVGFPVEEGYGGFVECTFMVGVNAKTENEEIVRDFLQYLLSDRTQRGNGFAKTVRMDTLRNGLMEYMESMTEMDYMYGGLVLELKKDGSSYLPEYLEIMERGIPLPIWNAEIGGVILEEAEAYFNGDKPAEDVAEIIQNRLQLYLDER